MRGRSADTCATNIKVASTKAHNCISGLATVAVDGFEGVCYHIIGCVSYTKIL